MDLSSKTKKELTDMIYDLISQRTNGKISPGEYSSRVYTVLEELAKHISKNRVEQTINDAYDRAMRGI